MQILSNFCFYQISCFGRKICENESKIWNCMHRLNCIYFVRSHSRPVGRLPLPTSSNTKTALTKSSPSSPNSSGLPTPPQGGERKERSISSIQTYRLVTPLSHDSQ